MPGMQKPHCTPPFSRKALAKRACSVSLSPSMVVTSPSATFAMVITQESTALPFSSTAQQPQAAWGRSRLWVR